MPTAYELPIKYITGVPAADLTTKRYHGVKYDTNGNIVSATAGDSIVGVLQEPNDVDQPAQVMIEGVSFVVLGGTVNPNDEVSMDAAGAFVTATTKTFTATDTSTATFATTKVVGKCVVGGSAGDIGCVLLK